MNFLHDLPVLVLGLGDSGLAMARWCARCGADVTVWDSRAEPPQAAVLARDVPSARRIEVLPAAIGTLRLVLKSPGLAPGDARIAPLLQQAAAAGIAVMGELELFARALADLSAAAPDGTAGYVPKVLAVTGTNGKTTTTAWTALLVERAGRSVATAGNIGPTLLDTLAARLDVHPGRGLGVCSVAGAEVGGVGAGVSVEAGLPDVWVLELSSFQLDRVRGFEPAAGALLNISQDHLDWHGTMDDYAAAKAQVFGSRAVMVVNRDDPAVEALVAAASPVAPAAALRRPKSGVRTAVGATGPAAGSGAERPVPNGPARSLERAVVRFGLDAPRQPGDFGLVVDNGMAWLVRARPLDDTFKRRRGEVPAIDLQRLMPADALRLRGRHNAANALAALALATAIGCPLAPLLHALRDYTGEPHRLQFVASVDGVDAYDDSKGTNVGATVAALDGLGLDRAPARIAVILGGDGKGQDFAPLAAPLARHARAVATIGRDAAAIEAAIAAVTAPSTHSGDDMSGGVPHRRFVTLEEAVAWCFGQARPGDAVLLSPACASLDMFRNYGHRAEVFVQAVHALAAEQGQPA